jgi:hypothetical protein
LARGLAEWQNDNLSAVLSRAESRVDSEKFANGTKSALYFSGLLELDFRRIVDSPLYDRLHASIRDVISSLFRDQRYVPVRKSGPGWRVVEEGITKIHAIRLPASIPAVLVPSESWLPNLRQFI